MATKKDVFRRDYLTNFRINVGLTMRELAQKANLDYHRYFLLEKGTTKSVDQIVFQFVGISEIINVSVYDLIICETDYQLRKLNFCSDSLEENQPDDFCVALVKARTRKGLSQSNLAKSIGVSKQYLSRVEFGEIIPLQEKIERICDVLGLEHGYFDMNIEKSRLAPRKRGKQKNETDNM